MEAQHGTNIRLDGRDMIMLSSNDYLGFSFHPKVIEAGRAAMLKWVRAPPELAHRTVLARTMSN